LGLSENGYNPEFTSILPPYRRRNYPSLRNVLQGGFASFTQNHKGTRNLKRYVRVMGGNPLMQPRSGIFFSTLGTNTLIQEPVVLIFARSNQRALLPYCGIPFY
jgi:hypothetical protein